MDDLISRQAAIDAILHNQEVYSNNFGDDPIDKYTIAIIDNDAQTIAQLPSAQTERKGKWIIVTDSRGRHAECQYCGEWKYHSQQKFCGECGARVEGEEE